MSLELLILCSGFLLGLFALLLRHFSLRNIKAEKLNEDTRIIGKSWSETAMERLMFALEDENVKMTILGVASIKHEPRKEQMTIEECQGMWKKWIERFPRFKQILDIQNNLCWTDDENFDLNDHFYEIICDCDCDEGLIEEEKNKHLTEICQNLTEREWDYSKPLWSCHLVQFNCHNRTLNSSVVIIRVHHTLGDGLSFVQIAASAAGSRLQTETFAVKERRVSQRTAMVRYKEKAVVFLKGLGFIFKLLVLALHRRKVFRCARDRPQPAKVVSISPSFELNDVKKIARMLDGTVNDVLIGLLAGVMRKMLIQRNDFYKEDLWTTVPVNLRQPGDTDMGMKIGFVLLRLPIYIEDPVERIKEIKKRMNHLKTSPEIFMNVWLQSAGVSLLPASWWRPLMEFFHDKFTATITNVPGPREAMYFGEREVESFFATIPRAGCQVAFGILSYNGKVTVSLTADPSFVQSSDKKVLRTLQSGVGEEGKELKTFWKPSLPHEQDGRNFLAEYSNQFNSLLEMAQNPVK